MFNQNCLKRIRRGEDDTVEDGDRSDSELPQNIGMFYLHITQRLSKNTNEG